MEPSGRLLLEFPVYDMNVLSDGSIAVVGGGGRMKSGIPNACEVYGFREANRNFSKLGSVSLADAPVALTSYNDLLISIIGRGCKNFIYRDRKLEEDSEYEHDIRVSSAEEQSAVVISKDGKRLIVASESGPVRVLSYPECETISTMNLHKQGVINVDISHDGLFVATAARDRTSYIWNTDTGEEVLRLTPTQSRESSLAVCAVCFHPSDSNILFTVESSPRKGSWLSSWHFVNGQWEPRASRFALKDAISAMTVIADGSLVAVSSAEGHVALFSWTCHSFKILWSTAARTSLFAQSKPYHALPVTSLKFSKSGKHLLTASADYTVAVWPAYKPWNFRGIARWTFWIISLFIAFAAILLAEDNHLPKMLLERRQRFQPRLEPRISQFQNIVRPLLRHQANKSIGYLAPLHSVIEPQIRSLFEVSASYRLDVMNKLERAKPLVRKKSVQVSAKLKHLAKSAQRAFEAQRERSLPRNQRAEIAVRPEGPLSGQVSSAETYDGDYEIQASPEERSKDREGRKRHGSSDIERKAPPVATASAEGQISSVTDKTREAKIESKKDQTFESTDSTGPSSNEIFKGFRNKLSEASPIEISNEALQNVAKNSAEDPTSEPVNITGKRPSINTHKGYRDEEDPKGGADTSGESTSFSKPNQDVETSVSHQQSQGRLLEDEKPRASVFETPQPKVTKSEVSKLGNRAQRMMLGRKPQWDPNLATLLRKKSRYSFASKRRGNMLSSRRSAGDKGREISRSKEGGIAVESVDFKETVRTIAKPTSLRSKVKRTMRKRILEMIKSRSAVEDDHRYPESAADNSN